LILKELAEVVNVEHRGQLYLICAVIELSYKHKEEAEGLLQESAKCSPECCAMFLDGESVDILPLHTGNEFSARYGLITFAGNAKVRFRPAITLPKIEPPLSIADSDSVLKGFFNFNTINPRPEAPWVNRNKGSIQFTESILEFEVEDSKRNSKKATVVPKYYKSQEIKKSQSSFVKDKTIGKEGSKVNALISKIKEICS
jgi:hypothetical protein